MSHKTKKNVQPSLTIILPVYNEERTIEKVLKKVISLNIDNYETIVVNDASSDDSLKIIEKIAKEKTKNNCTLKILNHKTNKGKGAGIKTALSQAKGLYVVMQDADLEYNPKDIEKLLNSAVKNNYDVIYGSRFLGNVYDMPKMNYLANKFYNFLIRSLYHVKITDMHTCFKMVKTDIMLSFKMKSNGFEYATELVSKVLKKGLVIHELPIDYYGRTKKEGKKINYKDGLECVYMIFKYKFSKNI